VGWLIAENEAGRWIGWRAVSAFPLPFAWEMAREMGRRRGSVGGDGWGEGEGQGALLFRSLECVAGPGV
jgi:hypothetical protein